MSVHKSKSYNVGYQTQLFFRVVQHKRDEKLFESFLSYFYSGKIQIGYNNTRVCFLVTKKAD